jgi:hypothetical protein
VLYAIATGAIGLWALEQSSRETMMMVTTSGAALMALLCALLEPNSVTWTCVIAFLSFATLVIAVDDWHRDSLTPRFERVWGFICASSLAFLGPAEIVFKDSIYMGKVKKFFSDAAFSLTSLFVKISTNASKAKESDSGPYQSLSKDR